MPTRTLKVATTVLMVSIVRAPATIIAGGSSTGNTPINDLGAGLYQGFAGGLYPNGQNSPPAGHLSAAMSMAQQIVPRDGTGAPDASGWIGMLSVGLSNTCHEYAVFERQEDLNVDRNARVIIVNGAVGGWSASLIADPAASYWQIVAQRLAALNLTEQQVQVVWLKEANPLPLPPFPMHATDLQSNLRAIVQIIHDLFPNVRLCYLSSRIYGGYGSWEPEAYETGFSVKWLIEDQIDGADPGLNYGGQPGPVEAPLLLWGPYLWADGTVPRSDGLVWLQSDPESDNTHPSPSGEQKVADLLSQFFANEPTAQPWYASQPDALLIAQHAEGVLGAACFEMRDHFLQRLNRNECFFRMHVASNPYDGLLHSAAPIHQFTVTVQRCLGMARVPKAQFPARSFQLGKLPVARLIVAQPQATVPARSAKFIGRLRLNRSVTPFQTDGCLPNRREQRLDLRSLDSSADAYPRCVSCAHKHGPFDDRGLIVMQRSRCD